jgi:hypothetical protein
MCGAVATNAPPKKWMIPMGFRGMITQLPLTSFQSMPMSDLFRNILYVRPGIATVGRIREKPLRMFGK